MVITIGWSVSREIYFLTHSSDWTRLHLPEKCRTDSVDRCHVDLWHLLLQLEIRRNHFFHDYGTGLVCSRFDDDRGLVTPCGPVRGIGVIVIVVFLGGHLVSLLSHNLSYLPLRIKQACMI